MQRDRLGMKGLVGAMVITAVFSAAAGPADADSFRGRPYFWRRSGHIVVLPSVAVPIVVHGVPYYYGRGRYYRHCSDGYVTVPAPVGAVVTTLPARHRTLILDGVTYHEYDGVYYKGGPAGYTVVPISQVDAPITIAKAVDTTGSAGSSDESLVVNVPNRNGSYTPVTLQLAGNGMYIGPQGEVYPNRPGLEQLQAMYGK